MNESIVILAFVMYAIFQVGLPLLFAILGAKKSKAKGSMRSKNYYSAAAGAAGAAHIANMNMQREQQRLFEENSQRASTAFSMGGLDLAQDMCNPCNSFGAPGFNDFGGGGFGMF